MHLKRISLIQANHVACEDDINCVSGILDQIFDFVLELVEAKGKSESDVATA